MVPETATATGAPIRPEIVVGVDVLRLFAAAAVVVFHLGFKAFSDADGLVATYTDLAPMRPASWQWTWWGWIGVQIFFVVSGLVISISAQAPNMSVKRFVRGRLMRLIPALLICATIALCVEIAFFGMDTFEALRLWLRTVLFHPLHPWIMGQFWTIGIELGFYALILALIAVRRVALLPAVAAFLICLTGLYWAVRLGLGGTDPLGRVTQLVLLQHGVYFGIGILLARSMHVDLSKGQWAAIGLGMLIALVQISVAAGWEGGAAGLADQWPMAFAVFAGSIVLVYVSLQANVRISAWVGAHVRAVRIAGMMTYPLYLVHNHIGKPVLAWSLNGGLSPAPAATLAICAAVFVSWLIARYAEPWLSNHLYKGLARVSG
jgi:peptidoglycan/LPS O-acetylase OafA/YrhL